MRRATVTVAGLAGLALGIWKSPEEFLAGRRFTRFEPGMGTEERSARRAEWDRAVGTTLLWARPERILKP